MKFLLDADMPRAAIGAVKACGFAVEYVRDIGLSDAADDRIEAYARETGAILITRDLDFSDIRRSIPDHSPGIVVLRLPHESTATEIAEALRRFLSTSGLAAHLEGRLAILETTRVRFRPPLPE